MKQQGFTLVELMIVIGILSVLAAISLPLYRGYIENSRQGALVSNMSTMELFEEDLRMRTGVYAAGTYDVAGGDTSLTAAIGWTPRTTDGTVYVVTNNAGISYQINATDSAGETACMDYPAKTRC